MKDPFKNNRRASDLDYDSIARRAQQQRNREIESGLASRGLRLLKGKVKAISGTTVKVMRETSINEDGSDGPADPFFYPVVGGSMPALNDWIFGVENNGKPIFFGKVGGGADVHERNLVASLPAANWDQTLAAATWTRMNNGAGNYPQVSIPVLGPPPSGTKWRAEVSGFLRIIPASTATVYLGAQLDNGGMGSVHGGSYAVGAQQYLLPLLVRLDILDPTVAHTIDFAIYSTVAQTATIIRYAPLARIYVVPT